MRPKEGRAAGGGGGGGGGLGGLVWGGVWGTKPPNFFVVGGFFWGWIRVGVWCLFVGV